MALVKINLGARLIDGMDVKFKAPCDCTEVTGLLVEHVSDAGGVETSEFTFRDAHGYNLTGLGNLFCEGAYVKAMLDVKNGFAYLQNAGATVFSTVVTLDKTEWDDKAQTVTVPGVKADSVVVVSAAPASHVEYSESGVYCNDQAAESLTFVCEIVPENDLHVNISILT